MSIESRFEELENIVNGTDVEEYVTDLKSEVLNRIDSLKNCFNCIHNIEFEYILCEKYQRCMCFDLWESDTYD